MGVNIENIQNCTERNNKLFTTFSQQLVTNGSIIWCQHDEIHDTVTMSNYNSSTGPLSSLLYAHVTCITSVHGSSNDLLKCNVKYITQFRLLGYQTIREKMKSRYYMNHSHVCIVDFSKITCINTGRTYKLLLPHLPLTVK